MQPAAGWRLPILGQKAEKLCAKAEAPKEDLSLYMGGRLAYSSKRFQQHKDQVGFMLCTKQAEFCGPLLLFFMPRERKGQVVMS